MEVVLVWILSEVNPETKLQVEVGAGREVEKWDKEEKDSLLPVWAADVFNMPEKLCNPL